MTSRTEEITSRIILSAKNLGSSATTARGAHRYLMKHQQCPWDTAPHANERNRGASARDKYLTPLRLDREERALNRLGKRSPRQIAHSKRVRDNNLTSPAESYLSANWPFRRSESSWAGGDLYIAVNINKEPVAEGWNQKVWSRNEKWSGNDTHISIRATRRTFRHFPNLVTPDGLLVIDAKRVAHREYQVVWVEQSRGVSLKTVDGWLIRGYHVQAATLDDARKKAAKARKKALDAALALRMQRAIRRADMRALSHIWVSFQDSLDAGNCRPSSDEVRRQLCRSLGGEIGGVRADVLMAHRDDQWTRRAIAVAAKRYASPHA
jgi:hypothetical protein